MQGKSLSPPLKTIAARRRRFIVCEKRDIVPKSKKLRTHKIARSWSAMHNRRCAHACFEFRLTSGRPAFVRLASSHVAMDMMGCCARSCKS